MGSLKLPPAGPQRSYVAPSPGSRRRKEPITEPKFRSSRGPTRSARAAGKGTLKLLLPGTFLPVSEQHHTGLFLLQSVQNLQFQPPMPRPPNLISCRPEAQ
ncbi:hypothetical protein XENTR_v10007546 [Xenopus tropicalis]|nr:hypothetical protein XENTR_v10007546 [Xenopus tropicalis]